MPARTAALRLLSCAFVLRHTIGVDRDLATVEAAGFSKRPRICSQQESG